MLKEHIKFIISTKEYKKEEVVFSLLREELKKEYTNLTFKMSDTGTCHITLKLGRDNVDLQDYKITITIKTYKNLNIGISIFNNEFYNEEILEKLKIKIKNILKDKENQCYWIKDLQIEKLAVALYTDIHKLENQFRSFINIVLCNGLGCNWLVEINNFIESSLSNKHERDKSRRGKVQSFADINDFLFSLDTGDLLKIVSLEAKKIDCNKINEIEESLKKLERDKNLNSFFEKINKLKEIKLDVWDTFFKDYLSKEFKSEWEEFEKNRNHVMHNKPIDLKAYEQIKKNIERVKIYLNKAEEKYYEKVKSYEEIGVFKEEIKYFEEFIAREEAGIYITEDSICEEFALEVDRLIEIFDDFLYFRGDLHTENLMDGILDVEYYYEVSSNFEEKKGKKLTIKKMKLDISDKLGETSNFEIVALINDEKIASLEMIYINPTMEYNEEGCYYMPASEGKLEIIGEEYFIESVREAIDTEFLVFIEEVEEFNKTYGYYPIYDESCPECGEVTVSNTDDFYKKDICVNCGEEHEVKVCIRCNRNTLEVTLVPGLDICKECEEEWLEKND